MLPFFRRRWLELSARSLSHVRARLARKRRGTKPALLLELLEARDTPASISWTGTAGTYNWGDAGNWSSNTVPTVTDDVTISVPVSGTINISGANYSVHSLTDTTGALSIASNASLDLAAASATSTFGKNVTVSAGGGLAVGAGASVQIGGTAAVALTDDGALTFATGDAVTFATNNAGVQIVVGSGGALQAIGTAFTSTGTNTAQLAVNSGAALQISNSSVALTSISFNNSSADVLSFDVVSGQIDVNSGAAVNIHDNDFSGIVANGVVASGSSTATIDFTDNYWGTASSTAIAGMIEDHSDNSALPTVNYTPYLTAEPTAATASDASALYNAAAQNVSLTASVISPLGAVNSGTVTFTLLNGSTVLGTATTANVASGVATASYTVPAGLAIGTYTIEAVYNGTSTYVASSPDTTHQFTVTASGTSLTVDNATASFSPDNKNVALQATVDATSGTVSEGTVTFTVLLGGVAVGSPVTVDVTSGTADATYALPAGTQAGTYEIQGVYNGTSNFAGSVDTSHSLVVTPAVTTTTVAPESVAFSASAQSVNLSAVFTSPGETVDEGTATFTVLQGATVIGTAVTVNVTNGAASATYTLPAGTAAGTYTIQVTYSGTNFASPTATQSLVIANYSSATDASSTSTTYNSSAQSVNLSAVFTSPGGTVNQGTATFTVLRGSTVIGAAVTVNVTNGAASAAYTLPAGTAAGTYTIQVVYNGTTNFAISTDTSRTLFVSAASTTATLTVPSSVRASSGQSISLNVTITSPGGTVSSGTETFTVLQGGTVIGSPITVAFVNGAAVVSYVLPGGTPTGAYTVRAVYSGTADYTGVTVNTTFQITPAVPLYAAGSGSGGPGVVTVFSPTTGATLLQFQPFGAYTGGVQVAVGDTTGDGYDDLIVMAGPGALNGLIQIYSGQNFSLISEYYAFPGYQGAFNIAAGDLTGNGIADVILSTATGGDFVFAYAGDTNNFIVSPFSAFGGFTGGVTIAAGDVLGNGKDQIIVGTASLVGAAGVFNQNGQLLQPYYFAPIPMNGVNVAAGDLNDSGHDDIIFGARTGSTLVLEFDGASQNLMGYFFAYPGQSFGVTVATEDPTGDGYANIVTGFTGNVPAIAIYSGLSFQLMTVDGQPSGAGGVNVAGA